LEWRFDPRSDAKLPQATGYDQRVIIMCSRGYTSSLAAASLQDLGLRYATDLDGGFHWWADAGLPVQPAPSGLSSWNQASASERADALQDCYIPISAEGSK